MIFCLRPKANKPNAYSKLRGRGVKMGFGFAISFFPIVFLLPLKVSIKFLKESRLLKCT